MSATPDAADTPHVVGGLSRRTQILRLLLRYRSSGVFSGMDVRAADGVQELPPEGTPEQFVTDLEALGPTFVKLGQMLSTRPDVVPPEFATALERMQENTAPIPVERIREIVEAELGVAVNKAFSAFDDTPLGSASLAQVHRAALRDGTPVAIKVQKPEMAAQVRSDLEVLKSFANAADKLTGLGRRIRFADWLAEFGKALLNLEAVCRALSPNLDTRSVVEDQLQHVMRARLKKSLSAANLASEAMELQALLREGPRKLSDILSLATDNRLQVRVAGVEECG